MLCRFYQGGVVAERNNIFKSFKQTFLAPILKLLHSSPRYVGRKFASLKCIANDGKAFTIFDGRVNRKKS